MVKLVRHMRQMNSKYVQLKQPEPAKFAQLVTSLNKQVTRLISYPT